MQHKYYDQNEAAAYLGLTVFRLNHCRAIGDAPVTIKLGTSKTARLVYRRTALDRWLKKCAAQTQSGQRAKVKAVKKAKADAQSEIHFRQKISEIIIEAYSFGLDDLDKFMSRSGYETIKGIPPKERDTFLNALADATVAFLNAHKLDGVR